MVLSVQKRLNCVVQFTEEDHPVTQLRCHKQTHTEKGLFRTALAHGELEGLEVCQQILNCAAC